MKDQTDAQIHALDRVMYLLEEKSIDRLVRDDARFKLFISKLYNELENKTLQLHNQHFTVA